MKKLFNLVLLSSFLTIIFFSCNKDTTVNPGGGTTGPVTQSFTSNPTLNKVISNTQPVLDTISANITDNILSNSISDIKITLGDVENVEVDKIQFSIIHGGTEIMVIDYLTKTGVGSFINTVLWDSATTPIDQGQSPYTGTFIPQHPLSNFISSDPAGQWIIKITYSGSVKSGVIKSWGITITYNKVQTVSQWQLISSHTLVNEDWNDVYFVDVNNFWGCGNSNGVGSIYRSTNGGLNWNIVFRDSSNYNSIHSIYFINNSIGYACGGGGIIYYTSNGGQNWSRQYITNTCDLSCIRFFNSSTGLVCGGDNTPEIYRTTNGGLNWTGGITSGVSFLECICFADANTAYAGGDWDILKSIDGGNTWSILITQGSVYRGEFPSIQFLNANTGYVAAGRDGVLYTSNGGVNWSSRNPNTGFGIRGVFCTDINNCYVGGGDSTMTNGKIYKSTNSGLTWNLQLTDPNIFIGKIQFLDANTGFAGGSNGHPGNKIVLYKTTTGGGK